MKNKRKDIKEKGITLVALVVTIIVLLILSGVTIRLVLDNSGLISRAKDTTKVWDNSIKNEEEIYGALDYEIENITENGIQLKVGDVKLKSVNNISDYYGQITNYKSKKYPEIDWQLFYVDDENYYVIASDYVENSKLPCYGNEGYGETDLLKSTSTEKQYSQYCASFCTNTNFNDYTMISPDHKLGINSATIVFSDLAKNYFKWIKSSIAEVKANAIAAIYMIDDEMWSDFSDGVDGAKAYGGPTMEMYALSYNAVSDHQSKLGIYEEINSTNAENYGYKVKFGNSDWSTWGAEGIDTSDDETGISGNMWCRTSDMKAKGMWMINPMKSSWGGGYYCEGVIDYNGRLCSSQICSQGLGDPCMGFRPVVSIPKSNTSVDNASGIVISANDYGKGVTWNGKKHADGMWRLFYAEGDEAYLILNASSYIYYGDLPGYGTSTLSDFAKSMNQEYTGWNSVNNISSYKNAWKVVASLLDKENWIQYKETVPSALWAIGAPSVEMYIKSFNQTHDGIAELTLETTSTGYLLRLYSRRWSYSKAKL